MWPVIVWPIHPCCCMSHSQANLQDQSRSLTSLSNTQIKVSMRLKIQSLCIARRSNRMINWSITKNFIMKRFPFSAASRFEYRYQFELCMFHQSSSQDHNQITVEWSGTIKLTLLLNFLKMQIDMNSVIQYYAVFLCLCQLISPKHSMIISLPFCLNILLKSFLEQRFI